MHTLNAIYNKMTKQKFQNYMTYIYTETHTETKKMGGNQAHPLHGNVKF